MSVIPDRCASCQAPVFHLRHEKTGEILAIDAQTSLNGTVAIALDSMTCRLENGNYPVLRRTSMPLLHTAHRCC